MDKDTTQVAIAERYSYLILGAGSVGKVYGAHLQESGQDVTFFVREKHKAQLDEQGIWIRNFGHHADRGIEKPNTITTTDQLNSKQESIVLVCTRSEQIQSTFPILQSLPPTWPIIFFTPGFRDEEIIQKEISGRLLLRGCPGFSAYEEKNFTANKISKWMPTQCEVIDPNSIPHSNQAMLQSLVQKIHDDISKSGLPTKIPKDLKSVFFPWVAYGLPVLIGAQYHGWHYHALIQDRKLFPRVVRACRQGRSIISQYYDRKPNFLQSLVSKLPPSFVGLLFQISMATPEMHGFRMWTHHGPKIQEQTHQMMNELIQIAQEINHPYDELEFLMQTIKKLDHRSHDSRSIVKSGIGSER